MPATDDRIPRATDPADGAPRRPLVIVSNRLPIRVETEPDGTHRISRSAGGLASALSGLVENENVTWVGWPGTTAHDRRDEVRAQLATFDLHPVFLRPDQENGYYSRICNEVFWPLFHYFTDKVHFDHDAWQHYVDVNERFAEEILSVCTPDATVWVHDFHLMLVPQLLRAKQPGLEIGFFLHIPFPSSEIYRLLPPRTEVLEGLLGADHIGFHTHDYARHFRAALLRILGVDAPRDHLQYAGRRIGIGVHPIGIDVAGFDAALASDKTRTLLEDLERRYAGRRLLLGVERLDYTKGVRLKLEAFAHLLEQREDFAETVTLLQVLVPSRLESDEYRELKSELEEYIGNVNGRFGRPGFTPIEYMHRNLDSEELVALYRFADALLVTPVRDGMNLVAQEYALCKERRGDLPRRPGALVLSEFAGAAQHLPHAFLVNPWDTVETVRQLGSALERSPAELDERMMPMAEQVRRMDSRAWGRRFLDTLSRAADRSRRQESTPLIGAAREEVLTLATTAPRRLLLLDYDGTLREFERTPDGASPTTEILDLLERLATDAKSEVHIVSGRHRDTLQAWFGHLPIHLSAEHGFAERAPGREWVWEREIDLTWMARVLELLDEVVQEVPGTLVERKPCGLAWHYRLADPDYGPWRARELHSRLEDELSDMPIDILHGHRVLEIRAEGVSKGGYVERVVRGLSRDTFVLCAGDDRTDEDMYRALPTTACTVHVGSGAYETRFRVDSPAAMRRFLRELLDAERQPTASSRG